MDRQEVLLKEYEVCQQEVNSIGSRIWQATAIFLSVNGAVLAYLFKEGTACPIDSLLLVLFVSVIIIIVLNCWKQWIRRESSLQKILYKRMRDIEDELGMWKNRYVHIVDQVVLKNISESDMGGMPKEKSIQINQLVEDNKSARRYGRNALVWIIRLLMISWGLLIVRGIINYFFPEFYQWLQNMIGV